MRVKSQNQIGRTSETVTTKLGVLLYAVDVFAEHSIFVIRLKFTKISKKQLYTVCLSVRLRKSMK